VENLLKLLIRHQLGELKVWSIVRVPSPEEEDRRHPHRELAALRKERTRTVCRIKGVMASQGIRRMGRLNLSDEQLQSMRLWNGAPLGEGLKCRLSRQWQQLNLIRKQMAEVESAHRKEMREKQQPDVEKIEQLQTLRGIGEKGSWTLVREFFGWREFKNRKQVGALAGYTPSPYDSGEKKIEQGISKAGNKRVRAVCVELAWSWLRHQPNSKLTKWFVERFAHAGKRARKVGIVAVARRLLIDLWRYLKTGAIPEGAELKAATARG
jgi:transposase